MNDLLENDEAVEPGHEVIEAQLAITRPQAINIKSQVLLWLLGPFAPVRKSGEIDSMCSKPASSQLDSVRLDYAQWKAKSDSELSRPRIGLANIL